MMSQKNELNENIYSKILDLKNQLIKNLANLRSKSKKDPEDSKIKQEISETEEQLKEINTKIKEGIPHIFRVIETLNKINLSNYGGIPELSKKIKITPDVLNNVKKVVSLANDQLIRQDGIGILEGEAGVGKNVLIDIFAHYTNRPVFTFPCNKRASKEDLTYQWLINENGTYKFHSKVYEAIRTPGAILVFDEINTLPPEVIKLLNGLFDYRRTLTMPYDNEHEKAKDDAIIFGTENPTHYEGTQKLPQDTLSRSTIAYIDYPELRTEKEGMPFLTFDEGLITYSNMPYYYKILSVKGYTKDDIKKINSLKLKKKSNQKLSTEEQNKINKLEGDIISEQEFVDAWNNIFNFGKEQEMIDSYGQEFVEGIKDIHTIIKMAHEIRKRYKLKRIGTNKLEIIDISVSQRELNKMLGQLCEGKTPKEAFINIYTPMLSDVGVRDKIVRELTSMPI